MIKPKELFVLEWVIGMLMVIHYLIDIIMIIVKIFFIRQMSLISIKRKRFI